MKPDEGKNYLFNLNTYKILWAREHQYINNFKLLSKNQNLLIASPDQNLWA